MTPLIREMVTLSPEPESAMWFDVGQCQRIEAMHVPAEVLMHPPFPRTAIVGIDSAGVKFALWVMAGDHSVTIGGVNAGQKYLTPFAVFETPEGLRYYRGDLEIDRATVNTTLRVVLGSLIKIKDASEGHRATAAKSPTNARRIAKGKPPLVYDWHTVKLEKSSQASEPQGGTHATPRRHQCRGHWRNCKSGKRVWVKDCWRGAEGAQSRENATESRKYATKDEQVLMAQVGPRNRGITTGTGEQIGEQISKLHWQSH